MDESAPVRLDRWLWAARFFKTRAQAKAAIEGGKVRLNGVTLWRPGQMLLAPRILRVETLDADSHFCRPLVVRAIERDCSDWKATKSSRRHPAERAFRFDSLLHCFSVPVA